jgi:hypothetical protein
VKYVITLGAVVLTSLGALALSSERAVASTSVPIVPIVQAIPAQLNHGARVLLAPLVAWAAEPDAATDSCVSDTSAR